MAQSNPDLEDLEAAGPQAAALTRQLLTFGGDDMGELAVIDFSQAVFLFCSGYASGTLPADFLASPDRALLAKPFTDDQVLRRVADLLHVR